MSTNLGITSSTLRRSALLAALLLAIPLVASAQDGSASADSPKTDRQDMSGMDHSSMDHSSMQGMAMPSASDTTPAPAGKPARKRAASKQVTDAKAGDDMQGMEHGAMSGMDHASMPGMDHEQAVKKPDAMQGMDHHGEKPGMDHGSMQGMTMGPMQGGRAPPDARSPDYSDGVSYGSMQGMEMLDNMPYGMLSVDQLEAFHGSNANGQAWEIEGWYGNDIDKLWLRTEGERSGGKLEDADVEVLWNRSVATFWSTQLGVRHDFGEGPPRTWGAIGVQGLSPYWFEVEATAYVGQSGRTAARLRAEYELLLTQRLILQPEGEINLYGKNDPARGVGSGLSDAQLGLRLRYEFNRQFAPYVGVNWIRRIGTTADYARDAGQSTFDRQVVAGVRIWF